MVGRIDLANYVVNLKQIYNRAFMVPNLPGIQAVDHEKVSLNACHRMKLTGIQSCALSGLSRPHSGCKLAPIEHEGFLIPLLS